MWRGHFNNEVNGHFSKCSFWYLSCLKLVIIFVYLSEYCCCSLITGNNEYNISFLWIWIFENSRLSKRSFQILKIWLTVIRPFKCCVFSCELGHWPVSISKYAYELPVITYHTQTFSDSFWLVGCFISEIVFIFSVLVLMPSVVRRWPR